MQTGSNTHRLWHLKLTETLFWQQITVPFTYSIASFEFRCFSFFNLFLCLSIRRPICTCGLLFSYWLPSKQTKNTTLTYYCRCSSLRMSREVTLKLKRVKRIKGTAGQSDVSWLLFWKGQNAETLIFIYQFIASQMQLCAFCLYSLM